MEHYRRHLPKPLYVMIAVLALVFAVAGLQAEDLTSDFAIQRLTLFRSGSTSHTEDFYKHEIPLLLIIIKNVSGLQTTLTRANFVFTTTRDGRRIGVYEDIQQENVIRPRMGILEPGEEVTFSVNFAYGPLPGHYETTVVLKLNSGRVPLTRTDENTRVIAYTVHPEFRPQTTVSPAQADLALTGIFLTAGKAKIKSRPVNTLVMKVKIRNAGDTAAVFKKNALLVLVKADGVSLIEFRVSHSGISFAPGEEKEVEIGALKSPDGALVVIIDPGDLIAESNEQNNSLLGGFFRNKSSQYVWRNQ